MSVAYQHLPLAALRPGMILSDELLDDHGQLLLPRGAVLTAATIALLPRHAIEALAVLAPPGAMPEPAADPGAVQQRIAHLFRNNDIDDNDDWATGILRRYIEDYRLRRGVAQ